MTAASTRRPWREQPPPAAGTVEVRVHGAAEDVDAFLAALGQSLPFGRYAWKVRRYQARSGGDMQYLKVTLPQPRGR
ncbi:hypothetical protein BJF79_03310 [Actinomadura sp. CNU-125]|uniref:hypothetical protein n=1 Tax=Actinomadura sp. CNU-125 TaxID=1904961 RepID=UPI000959DC87|nr:hypothetical protein [Actinomadura sp. CNU-125]OLT12941.1 hypothetical protein BJF79_03310 [Actinomadura sp. CNU-125]